MESDNINLTLPIKIWYEALQQLTDKQLIGMDIGKGRRKEGQILGTSLEASPLPQYDVILGLNIRVLRNILVAKEVSLLIHASLIYDPDTGILSVGLFKLDSKNRNFLLNKTLQILANRMYYRKILDKATYNLNGLIGPQLIALNDKLRSGISFSDGLILNGTLENISITSIEPLADHILVHVYFKGGIEITIQRLPDIGSDL